MDARNVMLMNASLYRKSVVSAADFSTRPSTTIINLARARDLGFNFKCMPLEIKGPTSREYFLHVINTFPRHRAERFTIQQTRTKRITN